MNRWLGRLAAILFLLAVIVVLALVLGAEFYTDALWFGSLGFGPVFWTTIGTKWLLSLAVGVATALFVFVNLSLTRSAIRQAVGRFGEQVPFQAVSDRALRWVMAGISLFFGFSSGASIAQYWDVVLKFLNRVPFGIADPVFNTDAGYYVFQLPLYMMLYSWLMGVLTLTLLAAAVIYFLARNLWLEGLRLKGAVKARVHVSVLLASILLLKAWGYILSMHQLVYSPRGVAFGASYTDVHISIPVFKILAVVALFAALLLLVNLFRHSERLIVGSLILLSLASLVLGSVVPDLYQRFVVEPDEPKKERPYIEYNVAMTLKAFGMDEIEERNFVSSETNDSSDLLSSPDTIANIRLWDWRPLQATYRQLQEIRPYYEFNHVDVDRYNIGGRLRQVMLAPRELAIEEMPNRTWINEHMQYTHGYGLVMSPVDSATAEGLPRFLISNIPPVSSVGLEVLRPEIYYGEKTNQYVIVKTDMKEFDYPAGDDNAYATYEGHGGVEMSSPIRRLAFALRFSNIKFLLANDINNDSRVMFYRNIHERVRRIAPFLKYDSDPYIVLSEGRLLWIQDAYTVSNAFPFSEPLRGWGNYVRNSVKIVIDAYHGDVSFFIADDSDPLIQAYARIFPTMFRPLSEMSEDLQQHLRYPVDLFDVQARVYATYHMRDPRVFYNREDQWNIPEEIVAGEKVTMEPYYVIMRLPGENEPEMVLMLPFTPARKPNMVAWMAAGNDGPNYGRLILYKFPKQFLTYGPMQIEAQIDQDAEISQQLTLWNQRGSRVIRGNTLVIPLQNSILFIEPIYLQAEQSQMPQLKRVIVAYGQEELQVVMEPTLAEALAQLVPGGDRDRRPEESAPRERQDLVGDGDLLSLIRAAAEKYAEARRSLQDGDWAAYGTIMEEFETILEELEERAL